MRTEEEKAAFLSKREAFRKRIADQSEDQVRSKAIFREAKAETLPIHRSEILNPLRDGVCSTKRYLRTLYLAYAMFKGMPYLRVEQKTNEPASPYDIWCRFRQLGLHEEFSKHQIELWLGLASATAVEEPRGLEAVA